MTTGANAMAVTKESAISVNAIVTSQRKNTPKNDQTHTTTAAISLQAPQTTRQQITNEKSHNDCPFFVRRGVIWEQIHTY